jgi:hypothetical protein
MSSSTNGPEEQADWEVTPEGLYIATRQYLVRRGYCCANRCRNCPYVNWGERPDWQHAPAAAIRRALVSPKALRGARAQLARHEQALEMARHDERAYHLEMIAHYRLLLERWR